MRRRVAPTARSPRILGRFSKRRANARRARADIYYDVPELRHLISLPSDATPAEEKPTGSDDPQDDPDYDSAGWGTQSASVSYTQIIPVLVKSNQELHERIVEHDAQIADLEAAVASRDQQIDEIRSELSDTVSRLEAVESG